MRPPWWGWDFMNPSLDDAYFQVHFISNYIDDARKIMQFMTSARNVVLNYLDLPFERKVNVFMYTSPMSRNGHHLGYDDMKSNTRDAYISMITPQETYRVRPSRDDIWYKANSIHEYVHQVTLYYVLERGKNITDLMPKWFREGLAEYVKLYQSSQEILNYYKEDIMCKFRSIENDNVMFNQLSRNNLESNRENHIGWAILTKYLIDSFSRDHVMEILNSDRNYLEDAIIEKLGENYLENWRSWIHINQDD